MLCGAVSAQQDCPQVDCPGICGRFVDADGDGFCDHGKLSQPKTEPKAEQPELLKALIAMEHRMAVTLERIGLTLSLLRVKVGSELPDVIYCQDIDFATVVSMGEKLFLHAFKLTEKLMEDGPHGVQLLEARADAKERMEELLAKLPQRFQFAKIKCLTEELKITERTLNRYMDELVEAKRIVRLSKGNYKKL